MKLTNDELREELLKLADENGNFTAEDVVRAATPKKSPLHDYFEWDDKVAGHSYRLLQAGELTRSCTVIEEHTRETYRAPAFIHNPALPENEAGYRSIEHVRRDPDDSHEALVRAFTAAAGHLKRAQALAMYLDPNFKARVTDVIKRLDRIRAEAENLGDHTPN